MSYEPIDPHEIQPGVRVIGHRVHNGARLGTIERTLKGEAKVVYDGGGHAWYGFQHLERLSLDAGRTFELRNEVKEAYAFWQADLGNETLEHDYFAKMDELDWNLASRGLERGETIDEELPLGTSLGGREFVNRHSEPEGYDRGY